MRLLQTTATETNNVGSAPFTAADEAAARRVADLLQQRGVGGTTASPYVLQELEAMGDAALPGLLAAFEQKRNRRIEAALVVLALAMLAAFGLRLALVIRGQPWRSLLIPVPCLCQLAFTALIRRRNPVNETALRVLLKIDDTRTLGVLIDVHNRVDDENLSGEAMARLKHLLPRMTYADRDRLDARHRRRLRALLKPAGYHPFILGKTDPELCIAIIKALVQSGDAGSLPTIRRLAERAHDADVRRMAALGVPELARRSAVGGN